MFIRAKGKYLYVVRSVRTTNGIKQQVVAYLGKAEHLNPYKRGILSFFKKNKGKCQNCNAQEVWLKLVPSESKLGEKLTFKILCKNCL